MIYVGFAVNEQQFGKRRFMWYMLLLKRMQKGAKCMRDEFKFLSFFRLMPKYTIHINISTCSLKVNLTDARSLRQYS